MVNVGLELGKVPTTEFPAGGLRRQSSTPSICSTTKLLYHKAQLQLLTVRQLIHNKRAVMRQKSVYATFRAFPHPVLNNYPYRRIVQFPSRHSVTLSLSVEYH